MKDLTKRGLKAGTKNSCLTKGISQHTGMSQHSRLLLGVEKGKANDAKGKVEQHMITSIRLRKGFGRKSHVLPYMEQSSCRLDNILLTLTQLGFL